MTAGLLIVLGVAAAGVGGELFVRGSVALAMRMRIAPGIVGATVVAFATSSPELSVGVNSALEGARRSPSVMRWAATLSTSP